MVWCDDENKALMLLAAAQTYAADTVWEVVKIENLGVSYVSNFSKN